MDEKEIDQRLQKRFESFEDSQFDEQNWGRLARTLSQLKGSSPSMFSSKHILYSAIILLLISNLILSGLLIEGNFRIQKLMDKTSGISKIDAVNKKDTIYLFNASPQPATVKKGFPIRKNFLISDRSKYRFSPQNTKGSIVRSPMLPENPGQQKDNSTIQEATINKPIHKALLSSAISEIYPVQKKEKQEVIPEILSKKNQDTRAVFKQAKKLKLSNLNPSPGFFIGLPRIKTDKSKTEAGFQFGIDLTLQLIKRLKIRTGISYLPLSYKIDDHGQAHELDGLIESYPIISEDQSIRSLHEVISASKTLIFPLGFRYDLQKDKKSNLYVEGGIYARWFISQAFEYEFTKGEDRSIRKTIISNQRPKFGGLYGSIGSQSILRNGVKSEIEIFVQKDSQTQGAEGKLYSLWGFKCTIRLNP